jgi:hypothetical protein
LFIICTTILISKSKYNGTNADKYNKIFLTMHQLFTALAPHKQKTKKYLTFDVILDEPPRRVTTRPLVIAI